MNPCPACKPKQAYENLKDQPFFWRLTQRCQTEARFMVGCESCGTAWDVQLPSPQMELPLQLPN